MVEKVYVVVVSLVGSQFDSKLIQAVQVFSFLRVSILKVPKNYCPYSNISNKN